MKTNSILNSLAISKTGLVAIIVNLIFLSNNTIAQNVDLDKKLGAESAKMVEVQMGLYPDVSMTEYVSAIGNRLVAALDKNPFEFQFHIADDPIPNAFALPGGYIYVTRGILALVNSEDELACVMAHEIIHVIKRHSVKQMQSSIIPGILELPGAIVGTVVSEDLGKLLNTPINTSNKLYLSSYSRRHETESDTKGIELAAKAGYDPISMNAILERLSQAIEILTNRKETKSYFDDHPFTANRVDNINKTVKKLHWTEADNISANFPMPFNGLVFGYNPRKGQFQGQQFLHPELNFSITFPEGWLTFNQPDAVGAVFNEKNAGVFVGLEDGKKTPEEYAKIFEEDLKGKQKLSPIVSEAHQVNNHDGYLVSMEDNTGDQTMYIHMLWLKIDNKVFKLIGVAPRALEPELKATAQSLSALSGKQLKSIEVQKIQLVKTKKDETIKEIVVRTNSPIKPEIIAVMNGVDAETKLDGDTKVKTVQNELYVK